MPSDGRSVGVNVIKWLVGGGGQGDGLGNFKDDHLELLVKQ